MQGLPTTALCTLDQAERAALGSEAGLEDVFAGELAEQGAQLIASASGRVRQYLGRDLVVRTERDLIARRDWQVEARAPVDHNYRYVPDGRPVLALLAPYDGRDVLVEKDEYLFAPTRYEEPVEYVAGYRRPDQEGLSAFPQAVQGALSGVGEIPTLPRDVQQVTAQIAVIRGRQALQGLVGQSSVQQDAGEFSASLSLSQADRQAERRQLQKIHHRRRLH